LFINIHSHHPVIENEFAIQNWGTQFESMATGAFYSVGLHPWHIDVLTYKKQFKLLEQSASEIQVLAIGECGLDKACATNFELQQKVFANHIELANTFHKPLIIHCVRAYEAVQQLLHQLHNQVPVIFHGFNKNQELAQQLISKGYYLSFGKALQLSVMQQLLFDLPKDKIFLETDDDNIDIHSIYQLAASALQMDINSLSLQIQKNTATVFGGGLF